MKDINLSNYEGNTTALMDYINDNPNIEMQATFINLKHGYLICSELTNRDDFSATFEMLRIMNIKIPVVYKGWKRVQISSDEWLMVSPSNRIYFVSI